MKKRDKEFHIRVNSADESKAAQIILFQKSFHWESTGQTLHVRTESMRIIFINRDGTLLYSSDSGSGSKERSTELTLADLIMDNYEFIAPLRVLLNNSYTAEIEKDGITVGCQTIKKEQLQQLFDALKEREIVS